MAELKTQKTKASPGAFLNAIEDPQKRADCKAIAKMMRDVTGKPAAMWGEAIVGFGSYHYVYASGREGDWMECGFSPRARNISIYVMSGFETMGDQLQRLGRHKTGRSCLYINRLSDIDVDVLREILTQSVRVLRDRYGKASG